MPLLTARQQARTIVESEIEKCAETLHYLRHKFEKLERTNSDILKTRIIVDIAGLEAQQDALKKMHGRLIMDGGL